MLQDKESHAWLEEALIAIERFQAVSNLLLSCWKIGKFLQFVMFLLHEENYSRCAHLHGSRLQKSESLLSSDRQLSS